MKFVEEIGHGFLVQGSGERVAEQAVEEVVGLGDRKVQCSTFVQATHQSAGALSYGRDSSRPP
jgi:hypothetical protein